MRSAILVLGILAIGCKPSVGALPPIGRDAADLDDAAPSADATTDDNPPPADVARPPSDAGAAVACMGDRQCTALGMVCDVGNGRCVGCNVQTDCVDGALCVRHACQVVTPCASSVTCPGQVCSTRLGFCVDCNVDGDCPASQQCRESLCVDRPAPCSSSRECSARGMVCDPTQGVCVECVADVDCGTGRYCGAARTCARQTCTPGETSCQDTTRQRACSANGSATTVTVCSAGQTCRGDRCQGPVCSPGAATCASPTARSVCDASGLGATTTPCLAAANVAAPRCAGAGVCGFECNAGYGDCDGDAANGCETALTSVAHCGACGRACAAGAQCAAGVCTAPPRCPAGMALIPGATFMMGSTARAEERPVHAVRLSTFCMDLSEVTVAAYGTCTASGCTPPSMTDATCTWRTGRESYPINCIDWASSRAYCQSRGGDLPTEAQWEYAARGSDGRTYPWGNQSPTASLLCWSRPQPCPVRSFSAGNSPFGLFDMAGNVYEWTLDWYEDHYTVDANPLVDPSGPATGSGHVYRGGTWYFNDPNLVRNAWRYSVVTTWRGGDVGFRCAHAPL